MKTDISKKIYEYLIKNNNFLEIGDMKINRAYLYYQDYEFVFYAIPNRKVINLKIIDTLNGKLLVEKTETINSALRTSKMFIRKEN